MMMIVCIIAMIIGDTIVRPAFSLESVRIIYIYIYMCIYIYIYIYTYIHKHTYYSIYDYNLLLHHRIALYYTYSV